MPKNTAWRSPCAVLKMAGLFASALCLLPFVAKADPFSQHDQPAKIAEFDPGVLSVVERDTQNRVTRETGVTKSGDRVERVTQHNLAGAKVEQNTTIFSPLPGGHPLYVIEDSWDKHGKLTSTLRDVYTLDSAGVLLSGQRKTTKWVGGRVIKQVDETWSPNIHGWLVMSYTNLSYYPDGDMSERVTESPRTGKKTDETWGPKGKTKRPAHIRHWNKANHSWSAFRPVSSAS